MTTSINCSNEIERTDKNRQLLEQVVTALRELPDSFITNIWVTKIEEPK